MLTFINPNASVRRIKAGKLLPAIAVKITMIDEIDDVEKNVSCHNYVLMFS